MGASHHLTSHLNDLTVTSDNELLLIEMADGRTMMARAKGQLRM